MDTTPASTYIAWMQAVRLPSLRFVVALFLGLALASGAAAGGCPGHAGAGAGAGASVEAAMACHGDAQPAPADTDLAPLPMDCCVLGCALATVVPATAGAGTLWAAATDWPEKAPGTRSWAPAHEPPPPRFSA